MLCERARVPPVENVWLCSQGEEVMIKQSVQVYLPSVVCPVSVGAVTDHWDQAAAVGLVPDFGRSQAATAVMFDKGTVPYHYRNLEWLLEEGVVLSSWAQMLRTGIKKKKQSACRYWGQLLWPGSWKKGVVSAPFCWPVAPLWRAHRTGIPLLHLWYGDGGSYSP